MSDARTALVAGSFDPITNGHLDIIRRARALFPRVVVAVLVNPSKKPLLSREERVAIVREVVRDLDGVTVAAVEGLLVDVARTHGATVVVKGLRSAADYDHEWPMARMNATLSSGFETVFLDASPAWAHVSSTLVRDIHAHGGSIEVFVPPAVLAHLSRRSTAS